MNDKTRICIVATLLVTFTGSLVIAETQKKTSAEVYQTKKLREQKEADIKSWALGCGAVLTEYRHERHDVLFRDYLNKYDIDAIKEVLRGWNIRDRDSLLLTLLWIENGGHSKKFEQLGKHVDGMNEEQYQEFLEKHESNYGIINEITVARRYYRMVGAKNLLGWDYGRYINLCRWGYTVNYISEEEAWRKIMPAAKMLQSKFDSWEDLGRNYLIGRQFWSYEKTKEEGYQFEDAMQRLLDMQSSPWNKYPWNMDLTLPDANSDPNQPKAKLVKEGKK